MLLPRLYLRADLVRSLPTPEQAWKQANAESERLSWKQHDEDEAHASQATNARIRDEEHARADADRRFAAKQRADRDAIERLRRAIEDDEEPSARSASDPLWRS